jgi:predicted phage terminase large subunit-like protein
MADLRRESLNARGIRPEKTKEARASIEAVKFESSRVYFPRSAPWLDELEAELFSFPGYFHDDQVDSISQALAYDYEEPVTRAFAVPMY